MEKEIKETLIALFAGINNADGPAIVRETARLDEIATRARGKVDPRLQHFLERRSYDKARMFLEGLADIPAGVCGGRGGRSTES